MEFRGRTATICTFMLRLKFFTPPEWAAAALVDRKALLLDHAYCEIKAAAQARALSRKHGDRFPQLRKPMESLAREEDGHASQCRALLRGMGVSLRRPPSNPYVQELRRRVLTAGGGDVLDQLIVASMIEARSCERFRLLAEACRGETLGRFYEDLFAAEARHHVLFVELAMNLFGEDRAKKRIEAIAAIEADIAASRPWGPRVH